MPRSKVYGRLQELDPDELTSRAGNGDQLRLHLLLFSSYVDNWRLYLHDMTRQFLELVNNQVLFARKQLLTGGQEDNLMTGELRDRNEYTMLNFETLQKLRHLAGKLIPIPTILQASVQTLKAIMDMKNIIQKEGIEEGFGAIGVSSRVNKTSYHLKAFESRLKGYLASCYVLQARIENMTKFVSAVVRVYNVTLTSW